MMLLKEVQHIFHKELDAIYGKEEVDSFFFLLTGTYLGLQRFALVLQPQFTMTKEEEHPFFEALAQLKRERPIQQILGETTFCGLPLKINPHVLIPRPETEELVHWVLSDIEDKNAPLKIVDVGTGSGCIAIALAKHLPNAKVMALDISDEALQLARHNAEINGVSMALFKKDILSEALQEDNFDIIISNPPYVKRSEKAEMKKNVLEHEPHVALFVEDDDALCFYRRITELAVDTLKRNGTLYFEVNQYLGEEMRTLLTSHHFNSVELRNDINDNPRMIKGVKRKLNSIVVFCGSSKGNDPKIVRQGYLLGQKLADRNITLVYGAGNVGIMGEVAEGALSKKGHTIGVIPNFLKQKEVAHLGLAQLIVTENMHERKLQMHDLSDGAITLAGGYGTLEELFEMITWAQLGLHSKPIGILNTNGFYDDLLNMLKTMVDKGFLKQENYDMLLVDEEIDQLLEKMEAYVPLEVQKWLDKEQQT